MLQLYSFAFLLLISSAILFVSSSVDVEISQNQVGQSQNSSLYETLCKNPDASVKSAKFRVKTLEEATKWYGEYGNDIGRQFYGSLLKGRHLPIDDPKEYEGMCLEGNMPFATFGEIAIGTHSGFGKLNPNIYNCVNDDHPGSLRCLNYNIETKFHATYIYRIVDTDAENVWIVLDCFPNDTVGWESMSTSPSLNKDEYAAVKKRILALGFDGENIVQMHDKNCNNIL